MNILWEHGPLFVRDMVAFYPEPRPHFNTVATTARILEGKGYVTHQSIGGSHRFEAVASRSDFRSKSLSDVIRNYFGNSYKSVVSTLVEEEKISASELREILEFIEQKKSTNSTSGQ